MVNKTKQQGFTLVEIAIVLVIIGLLLGGILKGQELITAARVRNLADQTAGIQAAYYGFLDRYRAVPGDMRPVDACAALGSTVLTACPGAPGGDGNQVIESFLESAAAWLHLVAAGFLQGSYSGAAVTTAAAYTAASTPPVAPTNPWNGSLLLGRSAAYLPAAQPPRLHLIVGRFIPVNVMRELDLKVDDSQPAAGILRSAPVAAGAYPGAVGESLATCVTGTPSIWNITGADVDCNGYLLY